MRDLGRDGYKTQLGGILFADLGVHTYVPKVEGMCAITDHYLLLWIICVSTREALATRFTFFKHMIFREGCI